MSDAVRHAYTQGQDDETLEPLIRVDSEGEALGRIKPGDKVIFYNIRGEREVELTRSLTEEGFGEFEVDPGMKTEFATMIRYDESLNVRVAFPPVSRIDDTLCEVISDRGLKQVKVCESEKAVHLTYFLNGKRQESFPGEERIIIHSDKPEKSYAEFPRMKAKEIADAVIEKIHDDYSVIFTNLSNVDVVGHVEDIPSIMTAVQTVDTEVRRITEEALDEDVTVIITADHGTVESWYYPDGSIDTGHTKSLVPFVLLDPRDGDLRLRPEGSLGDVAPTVLELMGVEIPKAMEGTSLLESGPPSTPRKRILLIVMDGWGYSEDEFGNLILKANTPFFDKIRSERPFATLRASGEAVGMPPDTVGNSEAGHLHIGAGRVVLSDRARIDRAIEDGSFMKNEAFLWAMRAAKQEKKNLHLLGIVSFYSSHGSINHLKKLMELARNEKLENVFIHSMLGRRGEHPESGAIYISKIEEEAVRLGVGTLVTVIGRHWALDREDNWDRIERAYRALVHGEGSRFQVR
jgi:2,3-bisphosphoglycerate-independent phosphoglycerate mutase